MSAMIIPKCCVMAATCFDSNENLKPNLETAFIEANDEIPPSNKLDHLCTGVALGILCAGSSTLFGALTGGIPVSICLEVFMISSSLLAPSCATACPKDLRDGMECAEVALYPDPILNDCTSGAFRDYRVITKTLKKYREIVANEQEIMNRE